MDPRPQRPSRRQRPTAVGGASSSRVGLAAGGLALSITLISGSVSRPAPSAAQPPDGVDAEAPLALDVGWTGGGEVLAGSAVGLWLGPGVQLVGGDVIRWELPGGSVETTAGGSEDLPAVFAEFAGGPDEEVRVELVRGGQVIGTVEVAVPVVGVRSVSVGDDEVGTAEATSGVDADGSPASLDPDRFTTIPGLASSGGTLTDAPVGPAQPVTGIGGTEWAVAAAVPVADRELAAVGYLQGLVDAGLLTETEALALLTDPALLAELGLRLVGQELGVSVGADGLLPDGSSASAEVIRVLSLVGLPVPGRSGSLLLTHAPGVLPRGRRFDRSEAERYALGLTFLDALVHLGLIDPADAAELAGDRRFVADLGSALQDPNDPEGRLAISVVGGVAGSRIDRALQTGSRDRVTARQAIAAWLATGDAAAIPRVLRDAGFVINGRVTVLGRWSAGRDIKGTDRNDVVIILGGTSNDSGVDLKKGNDLVVVFGGLDGDSELDLDRGHDTAVVFEYAGDDSDIEGNQGADDIALIGSIGENMDLDLGDESDRVFVSGVVRDLFIDGDSGNDQALVVGHASGLNFEGESGDDSLTVIGDLERSRVDGDKGDDRFTVHGSVIDSYLEFDRGDDTIDAYGIVEGSRLKTGRHDDEVRFETLFADGSVDLGRGDDRFEFTGRFLDSVLEGGRGDDIVTFRGELLASRIEAGKGDDQIFLDGLYDPDSFVGGGKGADVIDLRGQGVPGFVIDLGKNKRGDDVLRVRDEFRGSVDVSDPKRSFVYRGSTRVRNQDVVLLLGEGWEQIADPDGGLTLRRTDPETGAVLSDVQVIGDAEHLEKILAAVDPTTDPYGVFQNLDPEVRRRPLSIVISTIGTGLLVTSSFFTAGTTLAIALAGSAAATSIASSAIDGTDIGRILLNAGLTGLGLAGGALGLESLNHFGSIVRSVDAFASGDPLGGLLQAAGGGLGFASLEGVLPADVVSRFNQASAGLRATVAGFDGDLIDIVSGLATIVGASSTDAQAIEVLSDIGIGIGGYKAIKALTQGGDPGAGLDGLLNTLGALVTDNIVTPAEREKARQELERQLELLEAQTEGDASPLGQGGDDLPLGTFPIGEGVPETFPIGEPPSEGSNPFGRSLDGLGATFAAYREGQITLEDALLATRMTLDEFRTFTFFTDPLAGGSGHTDQVFLPAPPPSPGGNSKPLAVPYAPPNANHSLDESLQAQEALVDLPSVFPEEGSDRVFTDANGNVVAVEVGGAIVDHELVDLGDGLTEVRVDGDPIAIADQAGVSTIDGSGFATQTVTVTGILDEASLRFTDAYYSTQVFNEGGTGLVEERATFDGVISLDEDGNWVTSGGVPVTVERVSAQGSSVFSIGTFSPEVQAEVKRKTRIFLRDQAIGYAPGLTPDAAKRNLFLGNELAVQQLKKSRDALQQRIDQGDGNLQVPRSVLNYVNWLIQTAAGPTFLNRPVSVKLTEGWVHPSNPLEFVTDEKFRFREWKPTGPGRSRFQPYPDPGEGYVPDRPVWLSDEEARQQARDQGYVEAWQADNGLGLSDAVGLIALVVDSVLTPWIPETAIPGVGMKVLGLTDDAIDVIELSSLYTPVLNGITEWDEGQITGEQLLGRLGDGIKAHATSKVQSALVYNPAARGLRSLSTQLRESGSVVGLRFGSGRQVLLNADAADAINRHIGEVEAIARPAGGSQSPQSTESNKTSPVTEGTPSVPPTSPAVEVDSSLATELRNLAQQGYSIRQLIDHAKQEGYPYLSVELQQQLLDARTAYVQEAVDRTAAAVSSDLTNKFGAPATVTPAANYGNEINAAVSSNQYQGPTVRVAVPVVVTQNGYSVDRVLTFDARPGDVDRILDSIEATPNVSLAKYHWQVLADNGLSTSGLEARQEQADLTKASAVAGHPLTEWTPDAANQVNELNRLTNATTDNFAVSLTVEFNGKTYKVRLSNLTPAALNQKIAALKEKGFVVLDLPDDLVGSGAHPLVKVDSSGDVVARPIEEQPNQVPANQAGNMHYFDIFNRLKDKFGKEFSFNVTHRTPEHPVGRQILVSGLPTNLWFKTEEDAKKAEKYLNPGVVPGEDPGPETGDPVVAGPPPNEPSNEPTPSPEGLVFWNLGEGFVNPPSSNPIDLLLGVPATDFTVNPGAVNNFQPDPSFNQDLPQLEEVGIPHEVVVELATTGTSEHKTASGDFYSFVKFPTGLDPTGRVKFGVLEGGRVGGRYAVGLILVDGLTLPPPFDAEVPGTDLQVPWGGVPPSIFRPDSEGNLPIPVPTTSGVTANVNYSLRGFNASLEVAAQVSTAPVEPGQLQLKANLPKVLFTLSSSQLDSVVAKLPAPARPAARWLLERVQFELNVVNFGGEAWKSLRQLPAAVREQRFLEAGAHLSSAFSHTLDSLVRLQFSKGGSVRVQMALDPKDVQQLATQADLIRHLAGDPDDTRMPPLPVPIPHETPAFPQNRPNPPGNPTAPPPTNPPNPPGNRTAPPPSNPTPPSTSSSFESTNVNPGGGEQNCAYCAIVGELERRGLQLNAVPVPVDPLGSMLSMIRDFSEDSGHGGDPSRIYNSYEPGKTASEVAAKVLEKGGPNSRWIAVAHRQIGQEAHAFNVEVRDGAVRFVDAQGGVEASLDGRQVVDRDGQLIEYSRYRFFDLYRVDPTDPNPDYSSYRFFRGRPTDPGGPPVAGPGDESLIPEATTQPTILNPDEVPEGFLPTIGRPLGDIDPLTGAGWGQLPNPTNDGLPLPPPPDPSIGDGDTPEAPEAEPVIPEEPGDIPTIGSGPEGYDPLTGAELKGEPGPIVGRSESDWLIYRWPNREDVEFPPVDPTVPQVLFDDEGRWWTPRDGEWTRVDRPSALQVTDGRGRTLAEVLEQAHDGMFPYFVPIEGTPAAVFRVPLEAMPPSFQELAQDVEDWRNEKQDVRPRVTRTAAAYRLTLKALPAGVELPSSGRAHSGDDPERGTVPAPTSESVRLPGVALKRHPEPRTNDAEQKILVHIATLLRDQGVDPTSVTGKLEIYVENSVCVSCANVIRGFKDYAPGIEVEIWYRDFLDSGLPGSEGTGYRYESPTDPTDTGSTTDD